MQAARLARCAHMQAVPSSPCDDSVRVPVAVRWRPRPSRSMPDLQTVWLDAPRDGNARAGELCERHARTLTPPQGWRLDDRRGVAQPGPGPVAFPRRARLSRTQSPVRVLVARRALPCHSQMVLPPIALDRCSQAQQPAARPGVRVRRQSLTRGLPGSRPSRYDDRQHLEQLAVRVAHERPRTRCSSRRAPRRRVRAPGRASASMS